jgi:hypothetical protein
VKAGHRSPNRKRKRRKADVSKEKVVPKKNLGALIL